jgi:hypothetical protein
MDESVKKLLVVAVLGGIVFVLFFMPVDGQTPYEHARQYVRDGMTKAKESVKLDDGRSPFPEVDEALKPEDEYEDYDRYAPSGGQNNPTRNINSQIQNAAKHREQRMQRKQDSWQ